MSRNDELIAAYLDDSLTEEQEVELQAWLKADPSNVRQFVLANTREEQLRETVMSQATLKAATSNTHPDSSNIRRNRRKLATLVWSVLAILTAAWFAMPRQNHAAVVTLVGTSGRVLLQNEDGEDVKLLEPGAQMTAGTFVVDGETSRADFEFADHSTLTLSGSSELQLNEGRGKQLFLRHGVLLANVSRQPAGRPLRVKTPTAEAVVLGTSFAMNAANSETFLRVNTGTVELRRLADHQALHVSKHEQARASANATQPMAPEPVTALPDQWSAEHDSSDVAEWVGTWVGEEFLAAVPRMVFVKEADVRENHFHAGAKNRLPGLVTLRGNSVVRVRYRIQRPLNVGLFLVTHTEAGAFSGNFQAYVQQRMTPPDSAGWRTATVPITSFCPLKVNPMPFKAGCTASSIFLTTYSDDVGLEVAELKVISNVEKP